MKEFFRKNYPFLLFALLSIVVSIPLFSMHLSEYNEFCIHIKRVLFTKDSIVNGVVPPLLSIQNMQDFGYAVNVFYGPLTTYIPMIISLFSADSIAIALKLFTSILFFCSGLTMYFYVKKITGNKLASTIAGLIYMVAPYKLSNVFTRNAVGEYTAFVFAPMLFNGLFEVVNKNYKKNYLMIIGAIGLVLSHTITTIYSALFVIFYLVINYKKLKDLTIWKTFLKNILLILLICAFYIVPLLMYRASADYVIFDSQKMNATSTDVYRNTASLNIFDKSSFNLFGNELMKTDDVVVSIGFVEGILLFITLFCYKNVENKYKKEYGTLLIFSLISLLMSTMIFPWIIMPKFLTIIQFAWRMIGFFVLFSAPICGINCAILMEKSKRINWSIPVFIIVSIFILSSIRTSYYYNGNENLKDPAYEKNALSSEKLSAYSINRDYMPVKALDNIDYLEKREDRSYVLDGECKIESESKHGFEDSIVISNLKTEYTKIELPYLYYPGYCVKLNDKEIKYYESENGFIETDVNENGTLKIEYSNNSVIIISYVISIAGVIISVILLLRNRRIENEGNAGKCSRKNSK